MISGFLSSEAEACTLCSIKPFTYCPSGTQVVFFGGGGLQGYGSLQFIGLSCLSVCSSWSQSIFVHNTLYGWRQIKWLKVRMCHLGPHTSAPNFIEIRLKVVKIFHLMQKCQPGTGSRNGEWCVCNGFHSSPSRRTYFSVDHLHWKDQSRRIIIKILWNSVSVGRRIQF